MYEIQGAGTMFSEKSYIFLTTQWQKLVSHQAPVVQTLDNAIHWINHYPVDSAIGFANTYPLDSDLSSG